MALASDVFSESSKPDERVREIKAWLKQKGVTNLEPVSLFCDQLSKVCACSFSPLSSCHYGKLTGFTQIGNRR